MSEEQKPCQINVVLKGDVKVKFENLKKALGVTDPNTKTIEKCIELAHTNLIK